MPAGEGRDVGPELQTTWPKAWQTRAPKGGAPIAPSPVRVLLATDVAFYREGLAAALTKAPGIALAGAAADSWSIASLARSCDPHIVLLDASMPDSFTCALDLHAELPAVHVVVMAIAEEISVLPWAEAGVSGYVTRGTDLRGLLKIVRSVARGEFPCSPRVAAALSRRLADVSSTYAGAARGPTSLTLREREILRLVETGLSNREIASGLVIEVSTVKNHIHSILEKLGVATRGEAAALARRYRGSRDEEHAGAGGPSA